jgi:hypothetical protein
MYANTYTFYYQMCKISLVLCGIITLHVAEQIHAVTDN